MNILFVFFFKRSNNVSFPIFFFFISCHQKNCIEYEKYWCITSIERMFLTVFKCVYILIYICQLQSAVYFRYRFLLVYKIQNQPQGNDKKNGEHWKDYYSTSIGYVNWVWHFAGNLSLTTEHSHHSGCTAERMKFDLLFALKLPFCHHKTCK